MSKRPKIKLELSPIDQFLEIAGWFAFMILINLAILSYFRLPETIPTHFNFKGEADEFGSRDTIFTLPFVGAVVFVGMTILNRYPHTFNYFVEITEENAQRQYLLATRLIRYLKVAILLIFSLIVFTTLQTATGQADGLGVWFYLALIGILGIPTAFFTSKLLKNN